MAPHGSFDHDTKELSVAIGDKMDANVVWATDPKATYARRINVNRPTEMRWGMNVSTTKAKGVFAFFRDCVAKFPSSMSVEIHGDSGGDVIEMASVGVGLDEAAAMKAVWSNRFGMPLAIDAAGDSLVMTAGANKRNGLLSQCKTKCLHIEIPSQLREDDVLHTTVTELATFFTAIAP